MNHLPLVLTRTTSPSRGAASPTSSMLECDYDVRPTILYKCIQNKAWQRCIQILNHPDHATQASVWVVRKESNDKTNGKLRWRLLPLHAALIFQAPFHVIEALLEAYPEAAAAKDDQGMLPLHLALRNRPVQWVSVEELLAAYPAGVYVQDRKGRTPLQGAASASNGAADSNRSISTSNTLDNNEHDNDSSSSNNHAALSVLQLYTQIAVAGERRRLEPPAIASAVSSNEHSLQMRQLEQKHADTLHQFQILLQKEKQHWKEQLESIRREKESQAQQANAKEAILMQEIERLRQSPSTNLMPTSPTMQNMRVLELEQENNILREAIEGLYNQHQSLQKSMEKLQVEQNHAQEYQAKHLESLNQSVQQANASRQAHLAVWKSQLLQAGKLVTEKLAQVGLTSSSMDDDDNNEGTCLEQIEIDQDNAESQESSVVVVRVPKTFFQSHDESSPLAAATLSAATEATRSSATTEPRRNYANA
ncbi:hypothetical protein MPSEU_000160500 [Mayamaea pseudoterrestris]|nr:hypothetical protein MPSEU_000160500 [Mayamaea pseudoterrestris]